MVGDILQRINDHTRIQNYLTNSSLSILFSVFNIFIFSIVLFLYSFNIFAIFFVGSALYFGWVWLFMKHRAELDHKSFAQNSANQSNVIQLVTGMQEIKLNKNVGNGNEYRQNCFAYKLKDWLWLSIRIRERC
jgi:ATP-binding cassette subfamily B protein